MSGSQSPSHVKILLGFVVFCIIVQMLGLYDFTTLMSDKPKPKVAGSGGAGSGGAGSGGAGSGGAGSAVVVSPTLNTPNVKYIEIQKITQGVEDSSTFQIAELKAYDNNDVLIDKSQYLSAEFTPKGGYTNFYPGMNALDGDETNYTHSERGPDPKLLFTLNSLKFIKRVVVVNRTELPEYALRLSGVKLNLLDSNKIVIKSCTLTNDPTTTCNW